MVVKSEVLVTIHAAEIASLREEIRFQVREINFLERSLFVVLAAALSVLPLVVGSRLLFVCWSLFLPVYAIFCWFRYQDLMQAVKIKDDYLKIVEASYGGGWVTYFYDKKPKDFFGTRKYFWRIFIVAALLVFVLLNLTPVFEWVRDAVGDLRSVADESV